METTAINTQDAADTMPTLQPAEPAAPTRALQPHVDTGEIFSGSDSFIAAKAMAVTLASSTIVPEIYRREIVKEKNGQTTYIDNPNGPANCLIALELANRLKVSVLIVMQQVDMIHGRPGLRGTFLIGLVNGSGEFAPLAFECNNLDGDAYGYRARSVNLRTGIACDGPWITWKMVKAEGWQGKSGSKWNTMPEQMFQYRAASFWSRLFAPHITLGLYEADEAREISGEVVASRVGAPVERGNIEKMAEQLRLRGQGKTVPVRTVNCERDEGAVGGGHR